LHSSRSCEKVTGKNGHCCNTMGKRTILLIAVAVFINKNSRLIEGLETDHLTNRRPASPVRRLLYAIKSVSLKATPPFPFLLSDRCPPPWEIIGERSKITALRQNVSNLLIPTRHV
ncbi:hypothetical protein J6590_098489, partial [Homalodisca vitripennis]